MYIVKQLSQLNSLAHPSPHLVPIIICVCIFVIGTLLINSLSKFQVSNTVLTVVIMLYISSQELIHLTIQTLYHLDNLYIYSPNLSPL
jgi:hypothetical protein